LGRTLALRLAAEGVHIALHFHRSAAAADETLAQIRRFGVRGTAVQADFSRPAAAAQTVVEQAGNALGPIDLLVNNAAVFSPAALGDLEDEHWDRHLNVNLKAPIFLSQAFARQIAAGRSGQIVNIADWRALRPVPGHVAYTIAKAGLVAATRLLARELAPRIRVNAIAPGAILPPTGESDVYLERLAVRVPLQRTGIPEDVADALVFLLRSDFITGEVLHVTGGEEL
jgi:NAD(P)-dependent dehydrogenase (short-subunit alcohol dehydrogenase family)